MVTWRTSSLSGDDGSNCVEVAALPDGHHTLRDSKNRTGPTLPLTPTAWTNLVKAIKSDTLHQTRPSLSFAGTLHSGVGDLAERHDHLR